jgi:hypothetical protein
MTTNLSIAERTFLLMLKNGKLSKPLTGSLLLGQAVIAEMLLDQNLEIVDKKLRIKNHQTDSIVFQNVLAQIENRKDIKTPHEWVTKLFYTKDVDLVELIAQSLAQKNILNFNSKYTVFTLNKAQIAEGIIENLRANILEDGEVEEDVLILGRVISQKSIAFLFYGFLQDYFSKHEQEIFKNRIKLLLDKNSKLGQINYLIQNNFQNSWLFFKATGNITVWTSSVGLSKPLRIAYSALEIWMLILMIAKFYLSGMLNLFGFIIFFCDIDFLLILKIKNTTLQKYIAIFSYFAFFVFAILAHEGYFWIK